MKTCGPCFHWLLDVANFQSVLKRYQTMQVGGTCLTRDSLYKSALALKGVPQGVPQTNGTRRSQHTPSSVASPCPNVLACWELPDMAALTTEVKPWYLPHPSLEFHSLLLEFLYDLREVGGLARLGNLWLPTLAQTPPHSSNPRSSGPETQLTLATASMRERVTSTAQNWQRGHQFPMKNCKSPWLHITLQHCPAT